MTVKHKPITDEEEAEIQRQIAGDLEAPELTDEQLAQAKPFAEVFPDLAKTMEQEIARRGRPPLAKTKLPVTIRLNPETVAKFKATGKGWQSRMSEVLDKAKVG